MDLFPEIGGGINEPVLLALVVDQTQANDQLALFRLAAGALAVGTVAARLGDASILGDTK
jgi:hypothetical protein